jgi:PAS domain S-box-containing protein
LHLCFTRTGRLILNTIAALFASSLLAFAIYNFLKQKQVMAKLRESEERYQRLTENAKDIIFRLTLPDGRFEFISPSVTEVTGYTQQDFYSRPLFFKQLMDPGWQKNFEIRWKEILIGNTDPFFEYQIISKSGEHKWLHQSNVIITEYGVPFALEGIITE